MACDLLLASAPFASSAVSAVAFALGFPCSLSPVPCSLSRRACGAYLPKPPRPRRAHHQNLLTHRDSIVVSLARLRHEGGFVHQQSPRMIGPDLVRAAGNPDDPAAIGK